MTNGSLMKVERITECSKHSAILLTCIKRSLVMKTIIWSFREWLFYTGFTVLHTCSSGAQCAVATFVNVFAIQGMDVNALSLMDKSLSGSICFSWRPTGFDYRSTNLSYLHKRHSKRRSLFIYTLLLIPHIVLPTILT